MDRQKLRGNAGVLCDCVPLSSFAAADPRRTDRIVRCRSYGLLIPHEVVVGMVGGAGNWRGGCHRKILIFPKSYA